MSDNKELEGTVTITAKDGAVDCKIDLAHCSDHDIGHVIAAFMLSAAGPERRADPDQWLMFQLRVAGGLACGLNNGKVQLEREGRPH